MGRVERMIEMRNSYNILVGGLEEKTSLRRPWRRCKDYIEMDVKYRGYVLHPILYVTFEVRLQMMCKSVVPSS
jgi:hypothetical protein